MDSILIFDTENPAREHLLVALCTAMLSGTHPELHAHALLQPTTWFLHERP